MVLHAAERNHARLDRQRIGGAALESPMWPQPVARPGGLECSTVGKDGAAPGSI